VSDIIQASGMPSGLPPSHAELGTPPLTVALLRFVGFGVGGIVVGGFLLLMSRQAGAILDLVFGIPWIFLMLFLAIRLLILLATGGGLHYRRTKAAIADRRIGVSYAVKGEDHIVVVDEPRRLLCVNGDVFAFDHVKRLTTQSAGRQHRLVLSMNTGVNPVRNVDFLTADKLQVAFERVGNSLGFNC